jgi:hypothetical protein
MYGRDPGDGRKMKSLEHAAAAKDTDSQWSIRHGMDCNLTTVPAQRHPGHDRV